MSTEKQFRQIYEQTYRTTAAYITAKSRQTADAADLIQEVYLELYRILCKRGIAYIKNSEAMVAKLTHQVMARYYKRMGRRMEVYEEPSEDGITAEIEDIEALSVEELTEDRAVLDWTEQYLSSKGDEVRKIFHLFYRFDLTIAEIARLLDTSESDVKNKLYRTLKEIRTYWKGEDS